MKIYLVNNNPRRIIRNFLLKLENKKIIKLLNLVYTKEHKTLNVDFYKRSYKDLILRSWLFNSLGIVIPKFKKLDDVDLIFNSGKLFFSNKPQILYLENPYIITNYEPRKLNSFFLKLILNHHLKSKNIKSIVCMSKICELDFNRNFPDNSIKNKTQVIYPMYEDNVEISETVINNKYSLKENKTIKLLFIASQFHLKGGKETLEAFQELQKKKTNYNYSLTIISLISDVDKISLNIIDNNDSISLFNPEFSLSELNKNFLSTHHLFIYPSFKDSFGAIVLEVIKAGLPIIALDTYAIPEMVEHGHNGYLIENAISPFNKDGSPNLKNWGKRNFLYTKDHMDKEVSNSILFYILKLDKSIELLSAFALNSYTKSINKDFSSKEIEMKWIEIINKV